GSSCCNRNLRYSRDPRMRCSSPSATTRSVVGPGPACCCHLSIAVVRNPPPNTAQLGPMLTAPPSSGATQPPASSSRLAARPRSPPPSQPVSNCTTPRSNDNACALTSNEIGLNLTQDRSSNGQIGSSLRHEFVLRQVARTT